MDTRTYLYGLNGKCREMSEKDREILSEKDSQLAKLMALHGKKVYQERIAANLWKVLLKEIQRVEMAMYQTQEEMERTNYQVR